MLFKGYGITLERLKYKDIELLRQKRNADHVRQYMEYREEITPQMQEVWFQRTDNIHNHYFFITVEGVKIGVVNGCETDWERHITANAGIFIWDESYWSTTIPIAASLLLTDASVLLGVQETHIKILQFNTRAIDFNLRLGYVKNPPEQTSDNHAYVLTNERYLVKSKPLKKALVRTEKPLFTAISDDPEHPVDQFLAQRFKAYYPYALDHYQVAFKF